MDRNVAATGRHVRTGLSLIELLVCIGILGLLMAILLPAVQNVRAVSRSMRCKNNMRQIGLATHHFQDQKGVFPGSLYGRSLLPFLEQGEAWKRLDGNTVHHPSLESVGSSEHFHGLTVPIFACPSDSAQSIAGDRALNYLMNIGTGWRERDDGFLGRSAKGIKPSDVTDGLSQTVAFSERLLYRGDKESGVPKNGAFTPTLDQQLRRMATTDARYGADQMDEFADACGNDPTWFGGWANRTICTPISGGCGLFDYNHIMTPNENSCYNGVGDDQFRHLTYAAQTASSMHNGGVHSLLGDGSVRFVSDKIGRSVWRALGTRAGGEAHGRDF